jgi:hypothetical protein
LQDWDPSEALDRASFGKDRGYPSRERLLGQLLDYGTIRIAGAGLGNAESFHQIKAPLTLRKHVNEQIEFAARQKKLTALIRLISAFGVWLDTMWGASTVRNNHLTISQVTPSG